jgi:hypothetical protein
MMVDTLMRIPGIVSPLPVDFGDSARALSVPGGGTATFWSGVRINNSAIINSVNPRPKKH